MPARKAAPRKDPPQRPEGGDPPARLALAALKLLKKSDWSSLKLSVVAKAAKVGLPQMMTICPNKAALFGLILAEIGRGLAAAYRAGPGTAHDRLFDVAMAWFEQLGRHRASAAALYEGLRRDPLTLIAARSPIIAAANWLLVLAEADDGQALTLRALALALALGRTVPVWLADDADLTATMARLDMDLRRGESVLGRMHGAAD